ncbi:MAG: hypothetical protein IPO17_06885 [Flavobacteriales bacterium]|nr:hypothetical protein [Flavobacteriales bacterium]
MPKLSPLRTYGHRLPTNANNANHCNNSMNVRYTMLIAIQSVTKNTITPNAISVPGQRCSFTTPR